MKCVMIENCFSVISIFWSFTYSSEGADGELRYSFQKIFSSSRSASNNTTLSDIWWNAAVLWYSYRIGRSTVSTVIPGTCKAIYTELKDCYLKGPYTEDDWKAIAARFEEVWNFPVLGVLHGKHICTECLKLTGTLSQNYKKFFSMLLAVCDPDYCFTLFDFGS